MKLIGLVAQFGLLGAALMAEEPVETCDDIAQVKPQNEDEQVVVTQLEAIENDPAIVAQAQQEVKVPLEVFGGC